MNRIVLASGSPRRRALLKALGLTFEVITSDADEIFEGVPDEIVVINAQRKRDDVLARLDSPALVIAADTLVFFDDHVLGKPRDLDEARAMLARLSGKTHQVRTGLAITNGFTGREACGCETTGVTFRALSPEEIDRFVEAVRPVDRAGAYTVDGPGSLLVAAYGGCYYNVLGLPIVRLDELLRQLGHSLFAWMDADRSLFL